MTTSNETLVNLMSGGMIIGYLVAGLFFLKFWRTSRDPLFVYFAAALVILAVQRLLLVFSAAGLEEQTQFYVLRLLAYLLLLAGVIQKNIAAKKLANRGENTGRQPR